MSERPPQCLLGNGECPSTCALHAYSKKITHALGDAFDPELSRIRVVFGDAYSHDVRVGDVIVAISSCETEQESRPWLYDGSMDDDD